MMWAAFLVLKASSCSAFSTGMPRTWSATRRTFCAEILAPLNLAVAFMVLYLLGLAVAGMTSEGPGLRKLTEFMSNHLIIDQDRYVLPAVMYGNG